ncbi:hypothetical protein A6F55_23945 [Prescottella equi]|uniref:hypothetical protein n=1 Tax=Rhodococcus hoagii TaxID=43767 RepID=UPI000A115FA6|nr:hypothetical protein [Prescottella equi]ORJ92617.1 hypothetical protein A6F55_23945 [Prescottella equi]
MLRTAPWRDAVALLEDVAAQNDREFRDSENTAMLLDRFDFFLNGEYIDRTTDPEDPAVKAAADDRRRRGIKPPPVPVLEPIALRRDDVARIRQKQATELREKFSQSAHPAATTRTVDGRERVDASAFKAFEAALERAGQ